MKVMTKTQANAFRQALAHAKGEEARAERRRAVARMGGLARAQKASGYEDRKARYFDNLYGVERKRVAR